MTRSSFPGLGFSVGGSALAAGIGSIGARSAARVYPRLDKPAWAPPAGAFGPVWTLLYAAVGLAGWRLWRRQAPAALLGVHAGQLALNAAWPIAFFTLRSRPASLAVIGALDLAVAAEILAVVRRDPATAALLTPYLLWCLFATALNAAVHDPRAA
jgi:tryptophan-rich sensory protein